MDLRKKEKQLEKNIIRFRFAIAVQKILNENKKQFKQLSKSEQKESRLVRGTRQLAASADMEYSIVQKITSGKKNPALTTVVAIANGLNIRVYELWTHFDEVPESEVLEAIAKSKTKE